MLELTIPEDEFWDEFNEEFVYFKSHTIHLEHSLLSLSKWESKWGKAFLGKQKKTDEEIIDYIKCMALDPNIDSNIFLHLTEENYRAINSYIENPMSATKFLENNSSNNGDTVTSELIYYWMFSFNIPLECQEWHLNRLLTLIRIFSIKNNPPKKMGTREIMSRNNALNAARRSKMHSKG